MEAVQEKVKRKGVQSKTVFLPHCTWDKMGDILANSGGRCFGLFDELVSFFSTMNMYSSVKMQVKCIRGTLTNIQTWHFISLFYSKHKEQFSRFMLLTCMNTSLLHVVTLLASTLSINH